MSKRRSPQPQDDGIHAPRGLAPLSTSRKQQRADLDRSAALAALVALEDDLLTTGFKKFLLDVVAADGKIRKLMCECDVGSGHYRFPLQLSWLSTWGDSQRESDHLLTTDLFDQVRLWTDQELDKTRRQEWAAWLSQSASRTQDAKEFGLTLRRSMLAELQNSSNALIDLMADMKVSGSIALKLCERHVFYTCPKCSAICAKDEFRKTTCCCGHELGSAGAAAQVHFSTLSVDARLILEQNIWFEEGVARMLRREGFDVRTGYHVLGTSGVEHEVDCLAELPKDSLRILVECKTGKVTINDILIASGKMRDLGIPRGLVCLVGKIEHPDLQRLSRACGIVLAEDVLGRDRENWRVLGDRLRQ